VAYDSVNNRVFVADYGNNRVLVFSTSTITNGENASGVLGQANYTTNSANQGSTTQQNGLSGPVSLVYDSVYKRLFVADGSNNRVLVFSVPATFTNGEKPPMFSGRAVSPPTARRRPSPE